MKYLYKIIDFLAFPLVTSSAIFFYFFRRSGNINSFPITLRILDKVGIYPLFDNYYDPLIRPKRNLQYSNEIRMLGGINLNLENQIKFLSQINYSDELRKFPIDKPLHNKREEFYFNNGFFEAGDAEIAYSITRFIKPKKIIEIGCGNSTLILENAIRKNKEDCLSYECEHICI